MNIIIVFSFLLLSIGCTTDNNQPKKANEVVKSDIFETIDLFKTTDEPNNFELQIDTMRKHFEFCDITYRIVDTLPRFPGGKIELAKHIVKLYEPIDCAKGKLTIIGVLINSKGKVIGGWHKGFKGDCMNRLNAKLGEMSNWIPGSIDGSSVCVQMKINITDLLDETNKK
jgi:hypothetical protein